MLASVKLWVEWLIQVRVQRVRANKIVAVSCV